jgi:hypothetical protein
MAERGRPSIFSEELATRICERLAAGETLRAICRGDDMPHESTVRSWARDPEHPISTQYAKAREIGYEGMADEIIVIADSSDDARLQVDTRKWLMSKALPKIYGDRQTHDVELSVNGRLLALIEAGMGRAGER